MLSGCGTFYQNPNSSELAATFIEKTERRGLGWYRIFKLVEIDGKPVSHMGGGGDGWEIRVHPGLRRMVFHVDYLSRENNPFAGTDGCQCRAVIALELPAEAGKRYKIDGTVSLDHKVSFSITDLSEPDKSWVKLATTGRPVPKNITVGIPGGGFITVPSKQ
jgi:hypothetical protein